MILLLLSSAFAFASALSCLDADGSPTDSWTVLKAPKTGDNFLYASAKEDLYQPYYSLNDTNRGALSKTLQQLWTETDASYILFNDEPPFSSTYNFSYGHTKGLVATDSTGGFYIVHSFPKFPAGPGQVPEYQGLASNTWTYGQNAFCVSLGPEALDSLAYSFQLNAPLIYDSRAGDAITPNMSALLQGKTRSTPECQSSQLVSQAGETFVLFSKSAAWNNDLWSACVAPKLNVDLVVESWIRGSAIGPSCTGPTTVQDVQAVDFSSSMAWTEYSDHSKWATSIDGSIACHGDINRMTTQYTRGGGAICFAAPYTLAKDIVKENSC